MRNINLKDFEEWPMAFKLLSFVLIFIVVFYLGYWLDLSNKSAELKRATGEEKNFKEQITFVIRKNKSMQYEVAKLPEIKLTLNKWNAQLVPYNDLPELLNEILKIGGSNRLNFSSFTPGKSKTVTLKEDPDKNAIAQAAADPNAPLVEQKQIASYIKVPIKIVVVGNYHDIAYFVSQVANLKWIVAIDDFTITRESNTNLLGEQLAKQVDTQKLLTAELNFDVYHLP